MAGMSLPGGTTMYPSVPRSSPSAARKRCASQALANWEAQKAVFMENEALKYQGQEFADEILQTISDQWVYAPDAAPTGGVPGATPTREFTPPPQARPPAESPPGASSGSWSVVEELPPGDPDALARNRNRQAAPIDWGADEGQERGAVMGILGGSK